MAKLPPGGSATHPGRAERAARPVYWLFVALATAAFLTGRYVWLQDVPDWLYQGCIVHAKLLSGASLSQFGWKPYPVPNSIFTIELALLQAVLSPLAAARLGVAITIAGFGWALPRATAIYDPARRYLRALAAFPMVALSSGFWNGFIAYQMGALLLLVYIVLEARRPLSVARTACFGTLLFFSHGVTFMAFVLFVSAQALVTRSRRPLAGLLPGLALAAAYGLGVLLTGGRWEGQALPAPLSDPSVLRLAAWKAYGAFKLGPFQNFILADGRSFLESQPAGYYALVACNMGFIALLVFHGFRMGRTRGGDAVHRTEWLYGCAVFAAYLPLPFVTLHVVNLGERLLFLGLMAWVVAAPLSRPALAAMLAVSLAAAAQDARILAFTRSQGIPAEVAGPEPAAGGDFIERSLGRTRLRLFSHKLFDGAGYYRRIEARDFTAPCFATGILADRSTASRTAPGLPAPPGRAMFGDTLYVP